MILVVQGTTGVDETPVTGDKPDKPPPPPQKTGPLIGLICKSSMLLSWQPLLGVVHGCWCIGARGVVCVIVSIR